MKKKELEQLRYGVDVMQQYQAIFEDRAEVYAEVASQVASMKSEFQQILDDAQKEEKD